MLYARLVTVAGKPLYQMKWQSPEEETAESFKEC